jgi:hypothetical protein
VPIHVITRVTRTTEAGLQLTDGQRRDLMNKRSEVVASVGGKRVAAYRSYVGKGTVFIATYPSLEAAEKARRGIWGQDGLNFQRYFTYEMDILSEMPLDA